jgi:hypothetical protein
MLNTRDVKSQNNHKVFCDYFTLTIVETATKNSNDTSYIFSLIQAFENFRSFSTVRTETLRSRAISLLERWA